MAKERKITRAKGGSLEREVDVEKIEIPDLWHVAMRVMEAGDKHGSEQILEAWHLCHDMKRALLEL